MGKEKDLEYIIIRMEADMKVLGVKVCRMGLDLFFQGMTRLEINGRTELEKKMMLDL